MKTSIKALSLLLAGMMAFGLASCKDDEIDPGIDSPEANVPIPTEDEVKTTVSKSYAVLGEHFDEVTPYVLKRMTGQRYNYSPADSYIADDVEVVFLDYDALLEISEEMVYEIKEVFDRGGAIYLHKPHSLALEFFKLILYDKLDDFMEWLEEQIKGLDAQTKAEKKNVLERDSYIIRRNSHYDMRDIHNGEPVTIEETIVEEAEDGNEQTRTVTGTITPDEPSDYEYGLFAENVAKWLNEENAKTRATDGEMLSSVASEVTLLPCHLQRFKSEEPFTCYAELRRWVSTAYNFETKQDYYHVVLEETYLGDKFNFGEYFCKKTKGKYHKYAGYTYGGLSIRPSLDTEGYTLKDTWNHQPENKGVAETVETVDGWDMGAEIGYDGGLTGTMNVGFTHRQTVTKVNEEISVTLKGSGADSYWTYDIADKYKYAGKVNGNLISKPDKNSISINVCKTRQSWSWLIDGTEKRGNNPFYMELKLSLYAKNAYQGGFRQNSTTSVYHDPKLRLELPVPNRFTKNYTVVADDYHNYDELGTIRDFLNSVQEYKDISKGYCAPTETILDLQMEIRWNEMLEILAKLNPQFSSLNNSYTFRLKDNKGNQIGNELHISNKGINK
ncbi:hypothetical protein [Bacteroides rodentium]|uniref:hypothetical protein n=1 Tax=Bacteroides rodentium TaxID=691816 RepID=UPI0004728E9F|nr:hypothetical protein [Bacteroides rodentium]